MLLHSNLQNKLLIHMDKLDGVVYTVAFLQIK